MAEETPIAHHFLQSLDGSAGIVRFARKASPRVTQEGAELLRPEDWLGEIGGPRHVQLRQRLETWIESGVLSNPLEVTSSLYLVLEPLVNRPVHAKQKISAINIDLLGVAEGAADLGTERISFLKTGEVAELTRSLSRGDAYDFVAELQP